MKVTRVNSSPSEVTLTVELAAEDESPFLDRSYRRTVSRLNIPGFRRGRAPRHIVEQMIGRVSLVQEALDFMVPETLDRVLRDEDVQAFAEPSIEVTDLEPVSFTATVPLEPTVELGDYRALRVETETVAVTDEQVAEALGRIREEQAVWEPVERPAEYGDRLNLNVRGVMDDETVVEDDDVEYVLNEENVLPFPGFAPNLLDMSEEESRQFTLTIPEDYPREQYAGKDVEFDVELLAVKERSLPELDDEFAKSVGEGYDDLDTLRSEVLQSLTRQSEATQRNALEQKSVDALCEAAVVSASTILYDRELELMESERDRMLRQQNLDLPTYLRFLGKTEAEFRDELRPDAERRLMVALVMRKLAEVEEISVSDEDVESEIERMLTPPEDAEEPENSETLAQMREYFNLPASRENVRSSLHSRRLMDRLTDITQGNLDADADDDTEASAAAADPDPEPASDTAVEPEPPDSAAAESETDTPAT